MDVQITNLVKDYGKFRALNDVSLNIGSGMFGLLGTPNLLLDEPFSGLAFEERKRVNQALKSAFSTV